MRPMCHPKVRYATAYDAFAALVHVRRKRPPRTRAENRWYRCDECAGYHLTARRIKHYGPIGTA